MDEQQPAKRSAGRPRTRPQVPPKKTAKLGEGKQPQFSVSLSPGQKEKLVKLAAKAGCSASELIRRWIDTAE